MTVRGHVPSKWWHWDLSPALATIYKTAGLGKGPEMSSREGGPQGRGGAFTCEEVRSLACPDLGESFWQL